MYGSKVNSKGEEVKEYAGGAQVIVGPAVENNKLIYLGLDKDQDGNLISGVCRVEFEQENGAIFSHKWWDSTEEYAIDNLNKAMLHICTKVVTEAEYWDAVANSGNFDGFITNISNKIVPKAKNMLFTLKVIYAKRSSGKYYASLPKFPAFIENAAVTTPAGSTFRVNPKYDFYSIPAATDVQDEQPTVGPGSPAPF